MVATRTPVPRPPSGRAEPPGGVVMSGSTLARLPCGSARVGAPVQGGALPARSADEAPQARPWVTANDEQQDVRHRQ